MEIVDASELTEPATYPFEDWADGQTRRALYGTDFHGSVQGFVSSLRRWARIHDVPVTAKRGKGEVIFRLG